MGCFVTKTTVDVITELKQLDMSLREMVYKYEIQLERTNEELKQKISERAAKDRLMVLLRRRKILRSYLTQCENRMTVCTQKQCSLEQLEITKMQLDAIKSTSRIFKRFTNRNTVEKVEMLQESMCALQEDMMDISDILEQPVVEDLDVEDELAELMTLVESTGESQWSSQQSSQQSFQRSSLEIEMEFPEVPNNPNYDERVPLAI
jgi:hypothetical protein